MKILYYCVGSFVVLLLAVSVSSVNAQQGNMSMVIEDKFTREIGTGQVMPPVSHSWVEVIYESPNTVILQGDLITNERSIDQRLLRSGQSNTDLWAAMDLLKNQYGFKLQQVMTTGIGTVENPVTIYILMTK